MEVTIHHEHHHGMEARLRKKLQLVQTALRLDRDVLDEMRGEISGFRSAFARTKALALERAATQAADAAAVCPPGAPTLVRGQSCQRERRRAASVQGAHG